MGLEKGCSIGGERKIKRDGILLIDKQKGETSYDVLRKLKPILMKKDIGKVGHAGTLDPFATGLLVVLLGKGTKLSAYLMSDQKFYRATVRLGIETDTMDPTGKVIRVQNIPELEKKRIAAITQRYLGKIEQIPPRYSAVKYRGVRAYKLARQGKGMTLKKRLVHIHSLRVTEIRLPEFTMEVECSGGTYIRRLASDLSQSLGTCGHLSDLRRLACGPFKAADAVRSSDIEKEKTGNHIMDRVIPLSQALPRYPEIALDETLAKKVIQGYQPQPEELRDGLPSTREHDRPIKLIYNDQLVALMRIERDAVREKKKLRIERVFSN